MDPTLTIAITAITALVAGAVGEGLRRRLNTLSYRYPDELDWPPPGPRWWIPILLALATAAITWRHLSLGHPEHLLFLLPTAGYFAWISATDLDVHRIPLKPTLAITSIATIALAAAALRQADPWLILRALLGGGLAYLAFWILNRASHGGLGMGDVRLAGTIGLTTSALSLWTLWAAITIAALAAAIWALITRPTSRTAYGPWLVGGWLAATTSLTP